MLEITCDELIQQTGYLIFYSKSKFGTLKGDGTRVQVLTTALHKDLLGGFHKSFRQDMLGCCRARVQA